MTDQWYYRREEHKHGPITEAQLRELVASGLLRPQDMVWKEGMKEWEQAIDAWDINWTEGLFPKLAAKMDQIERAKRWWSGDWNWPGDEPYLGVDERGFVQRAHWPHKTLVPEAAEYLHKCGVHLDLTEVTGLDTDTAACLAGGMGHLDGNVAWVYLDGLTRLSAAVATALAGGELHHLSLDGLMDLPVEVAEALVGHERSFWDLSLDGLLRLSVEAAKALGRHAHSKSGESPFDDFTEWSLSLNGLTTLPVEVAEALTGNRNRQSDFLWHRLSLDGLKSLSVDAAKALVWHEEGCVSVCERLSLNGLTDLPDDLAEALAEHVGYLYLNGLTTLSDKAAMAISNRDRSVSLQGLLATTLSEAASRALLRVWKLKFD